MRFIDMNVSDEMKACDFPGKACDDVRGTAMDVDKVFRNAANQKHVVSSASSTESMDEDDYTEAAVRDEIQQWLSKHGKALFALESSKFLSAEKRRESIKSRR